jgi:protein deglycase
MKALVLLADGTEEMEAVITCDILARAGIKVIKAAVHEKDDSNELLLSCALGTKIVADLTIVEAMSQLDDFAIIVLPGGSKGADTFCQV